MNFNYINNNMGIGDWGLGIGDWGLGPIPNPHIYININIYIYKYQKIYISEYNGISNFPVSKNLNFLGAEPLAILNFFFLG